MKRLAGTAVALVALLALGAATAATATATATPAGTWSWTAPTEPTITPPVRDLRRVESMACAASGRCVIIGRAVVSQSSTLAVSERTSSGWGAVTPLTGLFSDPSVTGGVIRQTNCAPDGACVAGGYYFQSGATFAFIDNLDGTGAIPIPGLAALDVGRDSMASVTSCTSAGNCSAMGTYRDAQSSFRVWVADQIGGTWGDARDVAGFSGAAFPTSMSCGADGDCVAIGTMTAGSNDGFIIERTGGVWGTPLFVSTMLPLGLENQLVAVSCPSPAFCLTGGYVSAPTTAMVMTRIDGVWSGPAPVPGLAAVTAGGASVLTSLSCGAPGSCAATGWGFTSGGRTTWVADLTDGSWNDAHELPGVTELGVDDRYPTAVACGASGVCVLTGSFDVGTNLPDAFFASRIDGVWSRASVVPPLRPESGAPGDSSSSAACTSISCSIGGTYNNAGVEIGWVMDLVFTPTPTTTTPAGPVAPAFTG